METLMKAIVLRNDKTVELKEVPRPYNAAQGHLLINIVAGGINAGDLAFIRGTFPKGSIPVSKFDISGVSAVGTVIEVGEGVSLKYKDRNVAIYRSLKFDENIVGTWCEIAHLHYQQCVLLPDSESIEDYAGSLVNIITPYAFYNQIIEQGHKGIICTAGNSATAIALLGISLVKSIPIISMVRTPEAKKDLESLGAKYIAVETDPDFKQQLKKMAQELGATAVFDGVGGAVLNQIIDILPINSTVYSYGFLGGKTPLTFHTSILMNGLTIKGFSNFRSNTVQSPALLDKALDDIAEFIEMPHFKTKPGKHFSYEQIDDALAYTASEGKKAILYPVLK